MRFRKLWATVALAAVVIFMPAPVNAQLAPPDNRTPNTEVMFFFCPAGHQLQLTTTVGIGPDSRASAYTIFVDWHDTFTNEAGTDVYVFPCEASIWHPVCIKENTFAPVLLPGTDTPATKLVTGPTDFAEYVSIMSVMVYGWAPITGLETGRLIDSKNTHCL